MPRTGRASVLTSNECLRLLKEKEEQKLRVAKEIRKQERLEDDARRESEMQGR